MRDSFNEMKIQVFVINIIGSYTQCSTWSLTPGGFTAIRRPDAATRSWLEDLNIYILRTGKRLHITLDQHHVHTGPSGYNGTV